MRGGQTLEGGQVVPVGHESVGGAKEEGGPGEDRAGEDLLVAGHEAGDDWVE